MFNQGNREHACPTYKGVSILDYTAELLITMPALCCPVRILQDRSYQIHKYATETYTHGPNYEASGSVYCLGMAHGPVLVLSCPHLRYRTSSETPVESRDAKYGVEIARACPMQWHNDGDPTSDETEAKLHPFCAMGWRDCPATG